MKKCLQCSNTATITTIIIGFESNGEPKKATINNRCWSCTNRTNDYMVRSRNENIRDARKNREEKEKEAEEELERQRNKKAAREHNSSHCWTCNKKSAFSHLIYDKIKDECWESWSNATDPENQLVFCNQVCYEKYIKKQNTHTCSSCGKKGTGNYVYNKKDPENRKFCSKACYKDFWTKKANEESQAKINELNRKKNNLSRKRVDIIIKLMEGNHDLDFDFENDDLLDEEQKEVCRKYQAGREEAKRLEKEKDNLSQGNTNDDDETTPDKVEKTCDQCGKKGTKYNLRDANDGKEFCSKPCAVTFYSQNSNLEKNCDKCNRIISKEENSYYKNAKNKTGTLCSNCWELRYDEEKSQIDSELWERLKAEVRNGASSAEEIIKKYGNKLTEKQKERLRDYDFSNLCTGTSWFDDKKGLIITAVIISLVIIFSVVIVKAKKRKRKIR